MAKISSHKTLKIAKNTKNSRKNFVPHSELHKVISLQQLDISK